MKINCAFLTLIAIAAVPLAGTAQATVTPNILISTGQGYPFGTNPIYIIDDIPGAFDPSQSVTVTRSGQQINVCISTTYSPGASTLSEVYVELGMLPVGTYQLSYLAANRIATQPVPECTVRASIGFPVINPSWPHPTVEYYDAAQDHYFITADSGEIAALDAGHFPGWVRTGQKFISYVPDEPAPYTMAPVCRFYGLPQAGLDSHFFTDSAVECEAVQRLWPNAWQLETLSAFYVTPLNPTISGCPPNSVNVYRLFNNRPDVNHRYTISPQIRDQMIVKGWLYEGPVWCSISAN